MDHLKKQNKEENEQREQMQEQYKQPKMPNANSYAKNMPKIPSMKMPKI